MHVTPNAIAPNLQERNNGIEQGGTSRILMEPYLPKRLLSALALLQKSSNSNNNINKHGHSNEKKTEDLRG